MSNYHRQALHKSAHSHSKSRKYINHLARSLVMLGLITSGSPLWLLPVVAAPTTADTTIDNQATGTFADLDDTSTGTQNVVSNTVSVTVAEVAGITITNGAVPSVANGVVSNFDFTITNSGNDPTKFFVPQNAAVTGGTQGTLQIIAYINAAGTKTTLTTPINITAAGDTGSFSGGTLGGNTTDGSIPAGAAIVVRVPVTVNVASGNVSATLGQTTPVNTNNTPYIANTNDVYTVDHSDPSSIVGEATGMPINGDTGGHRQEASATMTATVVAPSGIVVSGKVFSDADANVAINGSDAGTNAGSIGLTIYAISNSTGNVLDKSTVASDGTYSLTGVPQNTGVKLRLSNDPTVAVGATAPTAPSLPTDWFHTGENLNGTIDPVIATLGDIALTTTNANLINENFGIRQGTILTPPPAPATCNANFTSTLATGMTSTGAQLAVGANDLNWTAEWIDGPVSGFGTPYAPPRPVGPMPAVVVGNLVSGFWVNEPNVAGQPKARWISYPFRLSSNGNGDHRNADLDASIGEDGSANPIVGTSSDTVRVKFKAQVTLPANANTIGISLPLGVAIDNQFQSIKVNGVDNLLPVPATNPQDNNFGAFKTVNLTAGWQPGVNTIEVVMNSGQPQAGFMLRVEATSTQVCTTPVTVSGKVFSDADANVAINGSDAGTNAGSSTLTVYAVNAAGNVVDKATVNATTGDYTLSNVPQNSSVKLRLSNDDTVAVGATAPTAPSVPAGWYHTGENLNGTIDANIATLGDIALTTTTTNLVNYNFGIRQPIACIKSASDGSYATSGLNKNSLWWLNFECYDETIARTSAGQPFTFTLPDGSSMTLSVKKTGPKPVLTTTTTPATSPFSTFGSSTQYAGVTGKPAFYNATNPGSGIQDWTETLTNIVVTDKAGNARNYTFVSADAENSNAVGDPFGNTGLEQLKFATSGTSWSLVELLSKTASAPTNTLTGLGSANALWQANGSNNGSLIISTNNPSQVTLSAAMGGAPSNDYTTAQGGLFGIGMPKVTLVKNIVGRVDPADQFTTEIDYTAPTVVLKNATSAGTSTSITTGAVSVLPGNVVNLKEAMAAGSSSALTQYSSSISCTNANPTSTILPSGAGTSFNITPKIGDDITCTLTNKTKANVLMVKRITAIKDGTNSDPATNTTQFTSFVDDTTSTTATNDNNCNWPGATGSAGACTNTYTLGATSATAPKVKPGDEIEYTIYYLNAGNNKAKQLQICDQLDSNLTFQNETVTTPATIAPLNIRLFPGTGSVEPLTNATGDDKGQVTTPALAGTSCNLISNTAANPSNNVVVVDVAKVDTVTPANSTTLSGSTGAGIPTTSYGYIRIKATVK